MTEAEAMQGLQAVFRAVFRQPDLVLDPAMGAADLDGWDSLRHVGLILAAEAHFGLRLEAAATAGLATVGDLAAAIRRAA